MAITSMLLAAGGGFLLAVLWMDLMFDVQVLRHRGGGGEDGDLPEPVLASIAQYYHRVTTTARPMGHLVGAVMGITVVVLVVRLIAGIGPRPLALLSLLLVGGPVTLAMRRVFPAAVRLGERSDPVAEQSALARSICRDHLICLAGIVGFLGVQAWAAAA